MDFGNAYRGKTVLVTGHTGFKGPWLIEWLLLLGARVIGYSLEPPSNPSLFEQLQLGAAMSADIRGDVRSMDGLRAALREHQPHFVFHLAAQSLVRRGFGIPFDTFEINTTGSLNVLEAVRQENRVCVVIMVTTDKVYENLEWVHSYREPDALGGYDPYSASKACAEIIISCYRRSFLAVSPRVPRASRIAVASGRAGNVIGGGDWALDGIVPDSMRSLARGERIPVRNKHATRPWQHVLEPLSGYLHLAAELSRALAQESFDRLQEICSAFNFGPSIASNRTVEQLVVELLKQWPGGWEELVDANAKHEARLLNLTIDKAYHTLGWRPRWSFEESVRQTVDWYRQCDNLQRPDPAFLRALTQRQILSYADGWHYSQDRSREAERVAL